MVNIYILLYILAKITAALPRQKVKLNICLRNYFSSTFLSGFQWVWGDKTFIRGMEWGIGGNTQKEGESHLIGNKGMKLLHWVGFELTFQSRIVKNYKIKIYSL